MSRATTDQWHEIRRTVLNDYKRSHPCAICGSFDDVACMSFVHSDGPSFRPMELSRSRLGLELRRCVVMCDACRYGKAYKNHLKEVRKKQALPRRTKRDERWDLLHGV